MSPFGCQAEERTELAREVPPYPRSSAAFPARPMTQAPLTDPHPFDPFFARPPTTIHPPSIHRRHGAYCIPSTYRTTRYSTKFSRTAQVCARRGESHRILVDSHTPALLRCWSLHPDPPWPLQSPLVLNALGPAGLSRHDRPPFSICLWPSTSSASSAPPPRSHRPANQERPTAVHGPFTGLLA